MNPPAPGPPLYARRPCKANIDRAARSTQLRPLFALRRAGRKEPTFREQRFNAVWPQKSSSSYPIPRISANGTAGSATRRRRTH